MSVRVVRLGTRRSPGEGLRIGTVRRPPRGVRKEQIAARDFYDVWFPLLAPSVETMTTFRREMTDPAWRRFVRAYRREMGRPDASPFSKSEATPGKSRYVAQTRSSAP